MNMSELKPWTPEEFEAQLRARSKSYHIHHPYQVMMNEGKSTREQIQAVAKTAGSPEIAVPRKIIVVDELPVLGSGKTDYVTLKQWAETA